MQNRYAHTLTAEDLRNAAKKNPGANALPLTELYADQSGQKSRGGKYEGLITFQKDVERNTKINGNIKKVLPYKDNQDATEFHAMIREELGIDPAKLDASYSQNLLSILTHTLNYNDQVGVNKGYSYSFGYVAENPADSVRDTNFYRENNEVYCKIKIKEYTVSQSFTGDAKGEGKNLLIPGPIEVVYKLVDGPEGSMFALQHIATDSAFLRDVFLAKKEGLEKQLKGELLDVTPLTLLKNMENLLIAPPIASGNKNPLMKEVIQNSFFKALTAVGQYHNTRMSANELVEALERIKIEVESIESESSRKQSFIKRVSIIGKQDNKPATHAIQQAIDSAKRLPAYQVVAVVDKSNKEKVSPSNDAKTENAEPPIVRMRMGSGGRSA